MSPRSSQRTETAQRIFEKLNVEFGNIDFSKNVVCLATSFAGEIIADV